VQIPRVVRSATIRVALILAGIFGASALALVWFIYWAAASYIDRELDREIAADSRELIERLAVSGPAELIATINARVAQDIDRERIYIVADGAFRTRSGNIGAWPAAIRVPGWYEIPLQIGARRVPTRLYHAELVPDLHLVVGRDASDRVELRAIAINALFVASILVVLFAAAGGLTLRGMLLSRVEAIDRTSRRIVGGDLRGRVPVTGKGDEFDLLGQSVNQMLDQIVVLMDGARNLSNSIAHDLRTPLARARGRLEEIARDSSLGRERVESVLLAIGQIDGLIAIFNAILRIAEIDAGARRQGFGRVDLRAVLNDLVDLYAAVATERAIQLDLSAGPQVHVLGDRQILSQALANLVDNAVKYTPDGGVVTVTLAADQEHVRVIVADTGPGIPDSEKQRVIERFYRMEQSRATPGSGLGLALVDAVARLHGGVLRLRNNRPTGLRAILELPVSDLAAPAGG
jgi:signal transduction histidine kinase